MLGNGGSGIDVQADGNTVGGTAAGAGNIISGSLYNGVVVSGDDNTIQGNYIGTDVTGTVAMGNAAMGSWTTGVKIESGAKRNRIGTDGNGVADNAERNVISANLSIGVRIWGAGADANVVAGTFIGTDATGTVGGIDQGDTRVDEDELRSVHIAPYVEAPSGARR